ncbi:MAG TPA: hypothetical protein VN258_06335 [Mobilitalea sp.]|nr:hypothetical protein [Mobilitalea sp.]
MNIINDIAMKFAKQYDEFFSNCVKQYEFDIDKLKQSVATNRCVSHGNNRHYFIDGKYAFSIRQDAELLNEDDSYKYNVTLKSFYDESMVNYPIAKVGD